MRWTLALGLVGCLTATALADTPLRVARSEQHMRVDGSLREWRGARFVELGRGQGSLAYALAHRDGGLYLAARVRDDAVVRSRGLGKDQDALVLTVAMPNRDGRWVGTEVWLHPGVSGRSAAAAGVASVGARPRPAPQVKVVEGPGERGEGGYVIEAFIPWASLREADLWQMGRASLRYLDARRAGSSQQTAHTAPGRRLAELPPLLAGEGEIDPVVEFARAQGLAGARPSFDLKGNVLGDGGAERVSVLRAFVVLSGPSVGGGHAFEFARLPLGGGAVRDARLMDVTGDGRRELLVTMRQKNAGGQRTVWGVVELSGGAPQLVFGVETAKRLAGGAVESSLRVERGRDGRAPSIVVERGLAKGVGAAGWSETAAQDVEPLLLPWGPVRRRVYRYGDGGFSLVDEERDPEAAEAPPPASLTVRARPSAPVRPSSALQLEAVKRALGIPAGARPDRTLEADLAGDGRPETVYGFGARLAMIGPGIGGGEGYLAYSVPLRAEDALLDVQCVDVTGDGHAELLVRVRQALGDGVLREVLLVEQLRGQAVERVLAVEVARALGDNRIQNRVVTRGGQLHIEPGETQGWTASSYPFPDEPVGGVARLLLPWKERRPRRYRLVQGKLQP